MKVFIKKLMPGLFAAVVLLFTLSGPLFAGSNSLSKHAFVEGEDFAYFDLVVSLDWKPDQDEKDGRLKNAFQQFAKDVFTMTEGRQKVRKLYVFTDSEQMNTADIRFLDKGGRSNAHPGGIFYDGARILTYTGFSSGTARTDSYIGHTIAHEFGHYAYALYDEYVGSADSSTRPSTPLSGDNARPTIMNRQDASQSLSNMFDYDDAVEQATAQWRVYQKSAWETLVTRPTSDKLPNDFLPAYKRVLYPEFDGFGISHVLAAPTVGWDTDFEIIYVEGSLAVLVIDDSGSMSYEPPAMPIAISAAKQYVDLMELGENVAVIGFDSYARVEIGVTELVDQAAKETVKAAIDGLVADGGTSFSAALSEAASLLTSSSSISQNRYVVMMSDGQASSPDTTFFQENNIPVYTIGLGADVDPSVLTTIATSTGATYTASPTASELANVYAQVRRDIGGNEQLVGQSEAEMTAGSSNSWDTLISSEDGTAKFSLNWDAGDVMSLSITQPDGLLITPDSLPAGVTYSSGATYALYRVDSPAAGTWTSTATSSSSTDGMVTHEVSTDSTLGVAVTLSGGVYPEPIAMLATVTSPESVVGATVLAEITPPSGSAGLIKVPLLDNGVTPDRVADDGIYTGIHVNYTEDGDYQVSVQVSNPTGAARLDTQGALEDGVDAEVTSLPAFNRMIQQSITASNVSDLPSDASTAQAITADGTMVWGAIAQDDDEVWYRFDAVEDDVYYLQTSNLVSWDTTTMQTALTLYDIDSSTELASSSHHDGTDVSYIEWLAPASDTYFVKVAHASPGTGAYALTVGETDLYTTAFTTTSVSVAPAPASGGGGGSMDWLMLGLLVTLLLRRRYVQV